MLSEYPTERENTISTKSKASVQSPTTKSAKPVTNFASSKISGTIKAGLSLALTGWWNAYEDYLVSGFSSVRAYAIASAKKTKGHEIKSIELNIGHVIWATKHGYKRTEFDNFGCLINTRNPNQKKDRHKTKATVAASTVTKTNKEINTAILQTCRELGIDAKTATALSKGTARRLGVK